MTIFNSNSGKDNLLTTLSNGETRGVVIPNFLTGVYRINLAEKTHIKTVSLMLKMPTDETGENGFKEFDYGVGFVDILDSTKEDISEEPNFEPNAYLFFFKESDLISSNRVLVLNFDIDQGFPINFIKHQAIDISTTQPFFNNETADPVVEEPNFFVPAYPNQISSRSDSGRSFLPFVKLNISEFSNSFNTIQDGTNYRVSQDGTNYHINLGDMYSLVNDSNSFDFFSENILKNFNVNPNGILSLSNEVEDIDFQFIPIPHNLNLEESGPMVKVVKSSLTASGSKESTMSNYTLGTKATVRNPDRMTFLQCYSKLRLSRGGTFGDTLKVTFRLFNENSEKKVSIDSPWPLNSAEGEGDSDGPHSQTNALVYSPNSETINRGVYLQNSIADGKGRPLLLNVFIEDSSCSFPSNTPSNLIGGGEIVSGTNRQENIRNTFSVLNEENENLLTKDLLPESLVGLIVNFYISNILDSNESTTYRKVLDFEYKDLCSEGSLDISQSFFLQYNSGSVTYDANKNPGDPKNYILNGRWGKFLIRLHWN